jgi:hypothetical protein
MLSMEEVWDVRYSDLQLRGGMGRIMMFRLG